MSGVAVQPSEGHCKGVRAELASFGLAQDRLRYDVRSILRQAQDAARGVSSSTNE